MRKSRPIVIGKIIIIIVLIAVLLSVYQRQWRPLWLETAANTAIYPVFAATGYVTELLARPLDFIGVCWDAGNKVQLLSEENEQLLQRSINYDGLVAENNRLRDLLQLQRNQPRLQMSATRIIARSNFDWYKYITINGGSDENLSVGMAVVAANGLVGSVDAVYPYSSRVKLITANDSVVSAVVQRSNSRINAIVEGGGNWQLRMVNIPIESDVVKGDRVVTSGYSGTYPGNITIGEVVEIRDAINGLTKMAILKPTVEINAINEVMIIKSFARDAGTGSTVSNNGKGKMENQEKR